MADANIIEEASECIHNIAGLNFSVSLYAMMSMPKDVLENNPISDLTVLIRTTNGKKWIL